jgi:hypothetical protein
MQRKKDIIEGFSATPGGPFVDEQAKNADGMFRKQDGSKRHP